MQIKTFEKPGLLKYVATIIAVFLLNVTFVNESFAQCKPMIKIDGKATVVDFTDGFGLTLPFWLTENQTLAVGSSVNSISVIEFNVSGNSLEFSKVINVKSSSGVSVPVGCVWKIESIAKQNNSSTYKSATFEAGSYTWKVPGCAEEICIDMWGAGGGGGGRASGSGYYGGGGGGGGGYGSQCFSVNPGDSYTIVVGVGGAGGTISSGGSIGGASSVNGTGINMTVNGGAGGGLGTTSAGAGGTGGTSTAFSNAQGANGNNGCIVFSLICGAGGAGANGASGGPGVLTNIAGTSGSKPGGGGGGGNNAGGSGAYPGGPGADGKVVISW